MIKKKTTIEDLARMTQKGFDDVYEKMDKGFTDTAKGFTDIAHRFDGVENRLDAIEIELIDIKKKLENVIYRHEFEFLKDRVKNLETRLAAALKRK